MGEQGGPGAEGRPEVLTARTAQGAGRLAALSALREFRVAHDQPDPRGWSVVAADGLDVGPVTELIVDAELHKVRFLECRVTAAGHSTLVPVGFARLDAERSRVLIDTVDHAGFLALPRYAGLPLADGIDAALTRAFTEGSATP